MSVKGMVRDITVTQGCIHLVIVFNLQKLSKGLRPRCLEIRSGALISIAPDHMNLYQDEKVYKMSVLDYSSTKKLMRKENIFKKMQI